MLGVTFGLGLLTLSLVFGRPRASDFEEEFLVDGNPFVECSRGWSFPFLSLPEASVFECFPPPPAGQLDTWNRCIPLELRCDGKRHCTNGRDERDCGRPEAAACPFSYVPCQKGQCVGYEVFTRFFETIERAMSYCDEDNRSYIEHVLRKLHQTRMRNNLEVRGTCDGLWCEPDSFCVSESSVCDGYDACSDGSDEDVSVCTAERPCDGVKCVRRWSTNNNTHCIQAYDICNNIEDCEDGEDEKPQLCLNRTCPEPDDIKCADTGRCVSSHSICDGFEDCSDGSDEREELCEEERIKCDRGSGRSLFEFTVWDTHRNICRQGMAYCSHHPLTGNTEEEMVRSQRKREACAKASCVVPFTAFRCSGDSYGVEDYCIPENSVCDGSIDCLGGEDEDTGLCTPERKCFRGQAACGDGRCVREEQVCDGVVNCVNGADEEEEMCGTTRECSSQYHTSCGNGQCIWKRLACNNVTDCLNGGDEQDDFCRSLVCDGVYGECEQPTQFGGKCVPTVHLCTENFRGFCMDPVAEEMCEVRREECPRGQVPCGDGQCIEEEYICSGTEVHCLNGNFTSEAFCNSRECGAEQFSCGRGQCIGREKVCDGLTDCYRTQRDESHDLCGYPTTTTTSTTTTSTTTTAATTTTTSPLQGSVVNVAESCQDLITYCHQLSTLRVCERHQTFSREYCAKTCDLCSQTPGDGSGRGVNYVVNHYYNCKL